MATRDVMYVKIKDDDKLWPIRRLFPCDVAIFPGNIAVLIDKLLQQLVKRTFISINLQVSIPNPQFSLAIAGRVVGRERVVRVVGVGVNLD